MAYPYNLAPNGNLQFPNHNPLNPLDLSGIGYTGAMPQMAAPAAVNVPLSAPSISTSGSGVDLSGLTQGDAMSQALGSALGTGVNTDGAINQAGITSPEQGWLKSTFMNENGGLNLQGITSMLGSVMGVYGGMKQLGLAKDALNFQKESYQTNLANQTKSYNTAVRDRADSRAAGLGWGDSQRDEYVNRNKL